MKEENNVGEKNGYDIFSETTKSDIIIDDGGVVFGAYLNSDFMVEHGYTYDKDDLFRFMGSKYVQSYLGDTYRKVKVFLDSDRKVLFVGTPCQIAGLRTFLGNDHNNDNLIRIWCWTCSTIRLFLFFRID